MESSQGMSLDVLELTGRSVVRDAPHRTQLSVVVSEPLEDRRTGGGSAAAGILPATGTHLGMGSDGRDGLNSGCYLCVNFFRIEVLGSALLKLSRL